tara:strand:- start:8986 stop:9729 length:744 start_codon:yes stop_codon:yes gene_type:complete
MDIKTSSVLSEVDGEKGFFVGSMITEDINVLRNLVREQYLCRILTLCPLYSKQLFECSMNQYHKFSKRIDHKELWPKRARILGPSSLNTFKGLRFFKDLEKELNISEITGEEQSGWQEVYWRIVRPGNADIGNFHADRWFWDMGHGDIKQGCRRLKIWIALETVIGKSGLRVLPGSHKKQNWKYHGQNDHTGVTKPVFNEDLSQLHIYDVPTKPGDFIVFHDDLVHAGMPNQSDLTRVSLEATLLIL